MASQAQKVEKNSESLGEAKSADYWDEEGTPAAQAEAALSDVQVKPPLAPKQMAAIKEAQQPKETLESDVQSAFILDRAAAAGNGLMDTIVLEKMANAFIKDPEVREGSDALNKERNTIPQFTRRQVHQEL